ncbi:MAG: GNAT family N-acetyltransferase [Phycisphaeraceae bacterium]|nr:GNAT family N-acetyltransferase [Phycisphaeraceae bacterium]
MIQIHRITPDHPLYPQEVALRNSVLLNPIGLDVGRLQDLFPLLETAGEHYVAVFDHPSGPRVVGTAMLVPNHPEPGSGKLMQMTVDPQRQGEGIGTRLVVAIERRAFGELGLRRLFCHARDTAYGFYSSLGWNFDSDTFEEAGIPHRRMTFENNPLETDG